MTAPSAVPGITLKNRFIEASAGTGKTTALVEAVIETVLAGAPIAGVAAVTFTNAAAGELKLRLRAALEQRRASIPEGREHQRLGEALQHLERAFVGTIHALCAHMLRGRPVEADADPSFTELAEGEARAVFNRVFRRWIERKLPAPPPALRRAMLRLAARDSEWEPLASLERAAWCLVEWRDHPESWKKKTVERGAELRRLFQQAQHTARLRNRCANPLNDRLFGCLEPLHDFVERRWRAHEAGSADPDAVESELLELPRIINRHRFKEGWGPYGPETDRLAVVAAWQSLVESIEAYRKTADAGLVSDLRDELWECVALYEKEKQRIGALDFVDLLMRARKLLDNHDARRYYQGQFQHIFVDEFQDTDPLQAEILLLLSAENPETNDWREVKPARGKLFVVGDPKQSIYRFRRADVELYGRVREQLTAAGAERLKLGESRRGTSTLQEFVNAAFRDEMLGYLPLTGGRDPRAEQPGIVALPMPRPYGYSGVTKTAVNACAPMAVAAFVDWLLRESGWHVTEKENPGAWVPVRAEHICILFRRFTNYGTDVTREYVRRLEARGIRHVLIGSKSLHRREEVMVIRTALRAIEWPEDELSVFAALKGPLFAIPDNTLLKFRSRFGAFQPFRTGPEDVDPEFDPVWDVLALLARLHRVRNHRPLADIINRLLEHGRAHATLAFRKGGERVLANVYRLIDLARAFEANGGLSFRAFVEYLEQEAEAGEASEAPLMEYNAEGVKLMTVHKAKGLEFPVVILADPAANLTGAEGGDRFVDPDRRLCAQRLLGWQPWEMLEDAERENRMAYEEAYRLGYVAATRARDLLVVSAVGDEELPEGWLKPLYPALYPVKEQWRTPAVPPGCPVTGSETVLLRPNGWPDDQVSIKPGLHSPQKGDHRVVWFDPAVLKLDDRSDSGFEHAELLKGPAEAGVRRYREWKQRREQTIVRGSAPAFRITRATDAFAADTVANVAVEVIELAAGEGRPAGLAFGKLVHLLLENAALPPDQAAVERLAQGMARRVVISPEQAAEAARVALAALGHPLVTKSCEAARVHREFPVTAKLDDGTLVEGVIDLAYSDGQSWTIVEYKTGPAAQQRYRRQLQLYALAMQRSTGMPVRAVLLEV